MSTIGERVYKRRIEIGLTQDELAQRLGYKTRSSIAKIESNTNDFPQKKLSAFAEALRCDVNYLTGTEQTVEQMKEKAKFDSYIAREPEIQKMLKKYVALPDEKKQAVKKLVDDEFDKFFNGEWLVINWKSNWPGRCKHSWVQQDLSVLAVREFALLVAQIP